MQLSIKSFRTGGGSLDYQAPSIDLLTIATEQGFATSLVDYSESGLPGVDPDNNDQGDY